MTQEANNQQTQQSQNHQPTADQQAQKVKKTRQRKTIEQELAELEARKQKLLETKRRAEAHEKIIFGATVIAMLKDMIKGNDPNGVTIARTINAFAAFQNSKEQGTIEKIIEEATGVKPDKRAEKKPEK